MAGRGGGGSASLVRVELFLRFSEAVEAATEVAPPAVEADEETAPSSTAADGRKT